MMGPHGGYFDPDQAAQFAKSAPALPPGWIKFPAQRSTTIGQTLLGFIGGVGLGAAAVALFMTGTVFVPFGLDLLAQGTTGAIVWILEILACFAIGLALIV
ncbi:MAG: hypothetical protein ABI274_08435 [Ktedonobacterales bacterium]